MLKFIFFEAIIVFIFTLWFEIKKYKKEQEPNTKAPNNVSLSESQVKESISVELPKYETTTFHIAGTTFKDGRLYRQSALRMLKFKDEPMDGNILFEFEQYEYEGKPAVKIIANGRILGTVPADIVDEFIDKMENTEDYDIDYMVIGGNGLSYGCIMTLTWK